MVGWPFGYLAEWLAAWLDDCLSDWLVLRTFMNVEEGKKGAQQITGTLLEQLAYLYHPRPIIVISSPRHWRILFSIFWWDALTKHWNCA